MPQMIPENFDNIIIIMIHTIISCPRRLLQTDRNIIQDSYLNEKLILNERNQPKVQKRPQKQPGPTSSQLSEKSKNILQVISDS